MTTIAIKNKAGRIMDTVAGTDLKNLIPIGGLVLITVLFVFLTDGVILTATNLKAISNQAFSIVLVGIGATFVYSMGELDMSLGGLFGVCVLITTTAVRTFSAGAGLALSVAAGAASGCILGMLCVFLRVSSFIASICMSYILRGILAVATAQAMLTIPPTFSRYDNWGLKGFIIAAMLALGFYLMEYTRFGRYTRSIGGSRIVSRYSGINVNLYVILAHIAAGLCTGLAGFMGAARYGGVNPTTGQSFELDVLIAAVLGGLPLSGGAKAKIQCVIIGGLTIAMLANGMVLIGIPANAVQGIKGFIFVFSVWLTFKRKKGEIIH